MSYNKKSNTIIRHISIISLISSIVSSLVAVQLAGGSAFAFVLYLFLALVLVILPGSFMARLLLPSISGVARVACSFALGVGVLFACGFLASFLNILFAMFILPIVFAIYELWHLIKKYKNNKSQKILIEYTSEQHTAHSILMLCIAGGLFVYCFTGILAFAHASSAGNMEYHQDMMWSVGNGAAVQFGLPLHDIRIADGTLKYHYFSDALAGLLALAGNILPYDAACYYNYPLLICILVCAVYGAATAYGAKPIVAALLPAALLFAQGFNSPNTLELLRNMNGVPSATALACTLLILVFQPQNDELAPKSLSELVRFYLAFAIVCGVLLFSKNLYAILIICAVFAAFIVGSIIQRRLLIRQLLMAIVGGVVIWIGWVSLFAHATNNMVQQLWLSPSALANNIFVYLPLGAGLWLISLALSLRSFTRLPFSRLVVNAAAIGGVLAYVLFNHYSGSQTYFILAAYLFMWFCTLDVANLIKQKKTVRYLAIALACVSVVCTVQSLLPVARKGVQVAMRCAGLRPEYPLTVQTVTVGDEAAALWLRKNMSLQDVFATNRNAKDVLVGDGTWHYYTAMSGRQGYVESWRYGVDYGYNFHEMVYRLEKISDVIFKEKTSEGAFALARQHGIDYLLVSIPLKPEPFIGAMPVYENDSVRIYEVT